MVRVADLESGNFWKHIGMTTVVGVDGITRIQLTVNENLKQFYGNLHGGVIAALIDSAIAVAVNQQLDPGEGASTVEIKINYLRSISEGTLWAEGKVIQKGRKIVVAQGEIKNEAGQVLAVGTATFMVRQMA
ncbi:PaaI family thioesterase [Desulfosporosinus nitroreducens]|uniref:PaaI family thioesterase n=1 Tax=Desulfosporosinus nitroreducens TaxID=2018668 RepID=A0ABT8QNX2_9FIRM|nr:PaaI family thioesterase [Desulfosporosinus nitroreducens]MCO1599898.1 PaaI family thioesterase [Desulfosporosinus nitroreducens]MDO0823059.1 PaaI family thioesterase [Desulfosporosinus nitroreducens]